MFRITRVDQEGAARVIVSGRIGASQLPDLRRCLEAESGNRVVLDLAEVSLVDRDAVQFLVRCEREGIRLVSCPAYVREWMVRERRGR